MAGIFVWAILLIIIVISITGWGFLGILLAGGVICLATYKLFDSLKSGHYALATGIAVCLIVASLCFRHPHKIGLIIGITFGILCLLVIISFFMGKKDTENTPLDVKNNKIAQTTDSLSLSNRIEECSPNSSLNESLQLVQAEHDSEPPSIEVKGVGDDEKSQITMGFNLENILLDGIQHNTLVLDEYDKTEYAKVKLMRSKYPFSWNKLVDSEVRGEMLLVDYRLPSFDEMPNFIELVYKNEQPVCIYPNDKEFKSKWSNVCYKIVIRSLYELFTSATLIDIESISFNGIVKSLDLATGNESEKCILSVIAKRNDFETLDLSRLDAKQCFKRFKGISAYDLASLTPIPPLMTMNRDDKRFSDSYDVISNIESGENLAAMGWRDFENLVRELFEKEFSSDGSEVKITRASKDGGVDAVVFDPDPIRGGKIIIQAKRYTNIVGISAVRDLYGTVMNEGATKGILITTSDYGADSYNFIKDKPLSLLNGANLLHILRKHGCHAHIDLAEAKKLLNATSNE